MYENKNAETYVLWKMKLCMMSYLYLQEKLYKMVKTSELINDQETMRVSAADEFTKSGACGIPACEEVVHHWANMHTVFGSRPMDAVPGVCLSKIFNTHHDETNFERVDTMGDQRQMLEHAAVTKSKLKTLDKTSMKKCELVVRYNMII